MLTEVEEASMYWGGGGEALRCKRRREWDEGAWEEYGMVEEEEGGRTLPTCTELVRVEEVDGSEMKGEMVKCAVVTEMQGNGENGGKMANVNGGGCVEEEGGGQVTGESKRKPLRGKRRLKRSIREEGERKMANTLFQWLGTRPQ